MVGDDGFKIINQVVARTGLLVVNRKEGWDVPGDVVECSVL